MSERVIKIKNYRNVGVENKEELLLNTSIEKGELGSLVVVVGPNNSGKTNCLQALLALGKKNGLLQSDIPDFINDNPSPEISIVISNNDVTLGFEKTLKELKSETGRYFYSHKDKKNIQKDESTVKVSQAAQELAIQIIKHGLNSGYIGNIPQQFHQRAKEIINTQILSDDYELITVVNQVNESIWGTNYVRANIGIGYDRNQVLKFLEEFRNNKSDVPQEILDWEQKNQLKIVPNIVLFKETVATNSQLKILPENLATSPFFITLFSAINYNIEELINCYKKAKEQNMYGLLKKTSKDINEKLDLVSKQFNKLFYSKDKKYNFEITLETNSIYLVISIDDVVLHLDKQSAGFKWFFNFYFSVVAQNTLHRGDIIIMDEPALNLHMQGVQELRTFMKNFAKKSEITIVVSTHLPFFVDVDHLDEVRIVNRSGNGSIIENKFHAIGGQETDSLKPIKDALTVGRNVLYDQGNTHTIFVEGMTDYCYLTAFKNLFKIENVVFLPIQGLKKNNIIETLLKIEKLPTILIDGDGAGMEFKKQNKGKKNVEIISLTDIDENWTDIEKLFSPEDRPKTKFFNDCVSFKNRLSNNKVSKETKENFKKLLENISV